jgi:hypothetical protein
MGLEYRFTHCVGRKLAGEARPDRNPCQRSLGPIRDTIAYDDVNAIEKERIGVVFVLGQRLRLRGRHLVGFGRVVPVIVVMVVTAWAVMMVAVIVMRRSWSGVKMRSKIVSGRLAAAVRMAERCQLR